MGRHGAHSPFRARPISPKSLIYSQTSMSAQGNHISRDRVGQAQRQDRGQSAIGDSENENDEPEADDPQPENREATKPTN